MPELLGLMWPQGKGLVTPMREFPSVSPDDIKGLSLGGFSTDEIRALLKAGFTSAHVRAIIDRIRIAQKDPYGTDKLGLMVAQIRDLVNRVAVAVNSPSRDIRLEGQVGRALISDLVAFNRKTTNPATGIEIGEIDVETPELVIEITMDKDDKLEQVLKEKNNKLINPQGKQVILFAPNYSHAADTQFQSYGIPIIRTFKGLFDYLRRL